MRLKMETRQRFLRDPRHSFFLFGPRGTGKSTWLRQAFPKALHLDLLDPAIARDLASRPERLRELVLGSPGVSVVVLDEVQKAPELLNVVHALIEQRRRLKFVLTGSSARKLRRGGVNLLGGRAVTRHLHPYMAAEMGPAFNLDQALRFGMLPLVRSSPRPQDVLRAYAGLYVREEVQMEGLVRNVGAFGRFLEAVSFSHASLINVSNIARECGIERKVVEGYLDVLEDLLLAYRVPVFTRRAKRETSAHPKFYLFDAGVYRSLRPQGPLDRPSETDGASLEGLVAEHLRAWISYGASAVARPPELFFWRTRSGVEVDFVVYGVRDFVALEVKNAARVQAADLRGLRAFREDYPEARAMLLYRGRERLRIDGVWCLPVDEFLGGLRPGRRLPA
jgi:predicted AAA+ superfamily ATPase